MFQNDPLSIIDTVVSHTERVNSVRFVTGSESRLFVSSSTDKTAVLWKRNGESYEAVKVN